jgi:hypothetical protein
MICTGHARFGRRRARTVSPGRFPTFLNVGQVQRVAGLMYNTGMIATPVSVQKLLLK